MQRKMQNDAYKMFSLRRLAAYAVDWYLYSAVLIAFHAFILKCKGMKMVYYMTLEQHSIKEAIGIMILMLGLHCLLFGTLVKIINGQTIGKKLFHLIVVSGNGMPVRIRQLLCREILGIILLEGWFSPISSYFRTLLALCFGDIIVINRIWIVVAAASVLAMRCNKDRRMLHDYVGGTKVVPDRMA